MLRDTEFRRVALRCGQAPAWPELIEQDRFGLFVRADWIRIARESYYPRSAVSLHVAERRGQVIGLLPVCERRMNHFGLFLPVHEVFVGARGDHCVPLVSREHMIDVLPSLLRSAIGESITSGVLRFCHVPESAGMADSVEDSLRALGADYVRTTQNCRYLDLPSSVAEIDGKLPRKLRADLRRRAGRLHEDMGALELVRLRRREEMTAALPALFAMHDRRWLGAGRPGTFSHSDARTYYERLVAELDLSSIHFTVLTAGGRPVAYHLGMLQAGWLLHYKPTYDSTLSRYSPGKIHLRKLLDMAVAEGVRGVDFLQGGEEYKTEWTNLMYRTATFTIRTQPFSPSFDWITKGRPRLERSLWRAYNRVASRVEAWRQVRVQSPSAESTMMPEVIDGSEEPISHLKDFGQR